MSIFVESKDIGPDAAAISQPINRKNSCQGRDVSLSQRYIFTNYF